MRNHRNSHSYGIAAVVSVLVVAPVVASGQSVGNLIGGLEGSRGSSKPVESADERLAIDIAKESFVHAALALSDRITDGETKSPRLSEEALERRIGLATEAFVDRVRERLISEKGDGMLSRPELSQTLAEERARGLDALEEILRATLDGADPPPVRDDFDRWTHYAAAMASYTIADRNTPWLWGLTAGFVLVGLFAAGLTARGLSALASRLDKGHRRFAAGAAAGLSGPFYLVATVISLRVALEWVWLPLGARDAIGIAGRALLGVAVLWIAWTATSGVVGLIDWAASRTRVRLDEDAMELMRKSMRIGALALFGVFVIDALLGVELTSILATLGVLSIIASIAAQDTLRNLMGSFTIYVDRPFAVGDLIRLKGHFGTIEDIGFRSTRVRTLDGHRVTIPNAEVVREPIENVSSRPHLRHHYGIDVVYATPPDQVERAIEILHEILSEADHPEDHPPRVSFEEFAPYSLRLVVWYYSNTSDYWEARRQRTEVNLQILKRFNEEGVEFAFPTRSVYLETGEDPPTDAGEPEED